jgi:hypothetical protein
VQAWRKAGKSKKTDAGVGSRRSAGKEAEGRREQTGALTTAGWRWCLLRQPHAGRLRLRPGKAFPLCEHCIGCSCGSPPTLHFFALSLHSMSESLLGIVGRQR